MEPVVREVFPEAQVHWAEDGIVSAPREVAERPQGSPLAQNRRRIIGQR